VVERHLNNLVDAKQCHQNTLSVVSYFGFVRIVLLLQQRIDQHKLIVVEQELTMQWSLE
jgi:hypothetical protein